MPIFQYGIDVSRYQGSINWTRVAASGKQFAIIRLGSTNSNGLYIDPYFKQNVDGAHAAGLRVGVYYYTYAKTRTAVATEVNTFLAQLSGLQLEYPVFVDVEDNSLASLGRSTLTGLIQYAMQLIDQRGYFPGWYTYTSFANNYVNTAALLDYPLWIADYRGYVGYQGGWSMWQYSSTGSVNGISGNVDLNYAYADYLPQIIAAGKNGYQPTADQRPVMEDVTGFLLQVFGSSAEYFYTANVNDVVGYLPAGEYNILSKSLEPFNGFNWVTFSLNGGIYWTVELPDRVRIISGPCDELEDATQQIAQLQLQVRDLQAKIDLAREILE